MEQNETNFDPTIDEVEEVKTETRAEKALNQWDFHNETKITKNSQKKANPRIKKSELRNMIMHLTGLGKPVVDCVFEAYYQIVERLLLNGIEVPFDDLGVLSFVDVKPIPRKVRWNAALKDYIECLPNPGYKRVKFKEGTRFKGRMYWATANGEIPTIYEYAEWANKHYGEKSRFSKISKEELDAQEADRQWKIRTRGGLDRDPQEAKTDEQN